MAHSKRAWKHHAPSHTPCLMLTLHVTVHLYGNWKLLERIAIMWTEIVNVSVSLNSVIHYIKLTIELK